MSQSGREESESGRARWERTWNQRLSRSIMFVSLGTLFFVGGLIIAAAFGFLGSTESLVSWLSRNEPFRIFFVVIGALVGVIGLIVGVVGRFGAFNVLRFEKVSSTSKTMKEVMREEARRPIGRP
jgi:uncharacterized membrane protein YraQ (UPF0718 family)